LVSKNYRLFPVAGRRDLVTNEVSGMSLTQEFGIAVCHRESETLSIKGLPGH